MNIHRKKLFEVTLWVIFLAGLLKAYVLPEIALLVGKEFIWIPDWVSAPYSGHLIAVFMGFLPVAGVADYFFRRGHLERRKPRTLHLVFGVLLITGAFLAVCERIFVGGDSLFSVFWTLSDTPFSGLAFGLLIPFHRLEKEKRLLLFLSTFAFFYIGVPFAAAAKILNPSLSGLPSYNPPFWLDAWFWSDMIVNIGVGAFIFWALLKKGKMKGL
ncbi:MAG: hypothetical protein J7K72_03015 [Candidatus Aenigmarchaeota archaeon]|nr:hypothetical protein [Candidatus Aenigmarchaeota archaeon]